MVNTIDEHYVLIVQQIKDLKESMILCYQETGYIPDVTFNVETSLELQSNGDVIQKVEAPHIRFLGFKKSGVVGIDDRKIQHLSDLGISQVNV